MRIRKPTIYQELMVRLPEMSNHRKQFLFVRSHFKRKIVCGGRRGGKTMGAAVLAVENFLRRRRILYAVPVSDQMNRFWKYVTTFLAEPIAAKIFYKNETEHVIEYPGTDARIKAKTAWNADTLRGDFADLLILDEFQLMNEDTWELVGAPMLLDNNGDAVFLFTPPSLRSRSVSKANDPRHASKMYRRAQNDRSGRWGAFHFTSHDNPYLDREALEEISRDMSSLAYRLEILAEDVDEVAGALWTRTMIEESRVVESPDLARIVVAVDPSATATGDEAGVITAGRWKDHGYVLSDDSVRGSPLAWAKAAVTAYHKFKADRIVAEANNGGEMVSLVIRQVDPSVPVTLVHASRGKQTRAEPIAAMYEQKRVHHVGRFDQLEDEMCLWTPDQESPNRMDALVWALTDLMITHVSPGLFVVGDRSIEERRSAELNV